MAGSMYGWLNYAYLRHFTPALRGQVDDWMRSFHEDVRGHVGYLPGTVAHLWHGERDNRRYAERLRILTRFEFDPQTDLRLSTEGLWEWTGRKPELEHSVREYFRSRREDGSTMRSEGRKGLPLKVSVFAEPKMKSTPFQHKDVKLWLQSQGVDLKRNSDAAQVLVSENCRTLIRYARRFGNRKRYLLWTAEPRRDTNFVPWLRLRGLPTIRIMNVYTGDTFPDNLCYLNKLVGWGQLQSSHPRLTVPPDLTNRKIAMVAGTQLHHGSIIRDGVDIDIYRLRNELGLMGHRLGVMDVYGRGWPEGVSKGDSRGPGWIGAKREIIEGNYWFNLCFENTRIRNYCTEKIWDAIRMGCLPIYYGAPNIYDTFPHQSFIDYGELRTPEALFELVRTMTPEEFQERYNRCVDTLNRCLPLAKHSHAKRLDRLLEALQSKW